MSRQQALPGGMVGEVCTSAGSRSRGDEATRRNFKYNGTVAHSDGRARAGPRTVKIQNLLGRQLNDIEDKNAPPVVHIAGPMGIPLSGPLVSIIGSRNAPSSGLDVARDMSMALSHGGATIVSGLAAGVDAAVHQEAIDAGGRTVAVIGTPLDKSYPASNAGLQAEIIRDHLAVSQFAVGHPVLRSNFVMRNRTMALLSDATVIASTTGSSSGTRHQGWEAIRLGRPLFMHRSVLSGPSAAWAETLHKYGAVVIDDPQPVIDGIPPSIKMPEIFPKM